MVVREVDENMQVVFRRWFVIDYHVLWHHYVFPPGIDRQGERGISLVPVNFRFLWTGWSYDWWYH